MQVKKETKKAIEVSFPHLKETMGLRVQMEHLTEWITAHKRKKVVKLKSNN